MFLASVLIGKTIRGSPTMKVPPAGYDTTTDGQNIFVIYHDAGAYANYLITYKWGLYDRTFILPVVVQEF